MLITIDNITINSTHIVWAKVETRHYVNGSESSLMISFDNGETRAIKARNDFDPFVALDSIKEALNTL